MSKTKTTSTSSDKAKVAKAPSSNARVESTLAALPLGFHSLLGLLAYFALCFVVFIAPYLFSGFWPASYEYWPQALFLALTACACVLVSLSSESQIKVQRTKVATLLALFFALCLISIFGTVYLHDSLLEIARVAGVVAWFYITRVLLADEEYSAARTLWLLVSIALGITLVCVPAILDFVQTRNPRQFGTFYNPNLFANYCALALPLTAAGVLALWRNSKRGATSIAPVICGLVVLAIIALGLIVTSSKGGLLAALSAFLVFALAVFKAKGAAVRRVLGEKKAVVAIIALLVLVGGGVVFSQMIVPRLSSNLENDHSTMFRFYTWRGTLRMAAARPLLGFGLGSFPSAYTQFAETGYTRTSHQQWLQIAAESGFPALLYLLAACGVSTLLGWRALKTENWIFAAGALGAIAAFFVHGLTDAGWSIISIALLAMIVLAILEGARGERQAASTSNIHWLWLFAALPIALGSWITQRAQTGEDLRAESRELMARGAASSALEKATEAQRTDPLSTRLLDNFAQARNPAPGQVVTKDSAWIYDSIIRVQPRRALNYLNSAEYLISHNGSIDLIKSRLDKAVELDPNDTEIRFARGKWKLDNNAQSGWDDIEYIAALKDKPYGKYPATPEMVDLNFARAFTMLAERDFKNKKYDAAKKWIASGLEEIKTGRIWEPRRREMEQATQGAIDNSREQTMDELEAKLNELREKLKKN